MSDYSEENAEMQMHYAMGSRALDQLAELDSPAIVLIHNEEGAYVISERIRHLNQSQRIAILKSLAVYLKNPVDRDEKEQS